jgi:hypothetical protein
VKKSICLYRIFLIKREIIDSSEKTVLIRNIDCIRQCFLNFFFHSRIAQGIGILGSVVGAAMPTGGGLVGGAASLFSSQLQEYEYNEFQSRLSSIAAVGTTEELTDVARQVARELAERYEDQLLRLNARSDEVSLICRWCCSCFRRSNKDPSTAEKESTLKNHPTGQIAQFGIALVVQAIFDGDMDEQAYSARIKPSDLVKNIVEIICRAKPTITKKLLRKMNLDKDAILPYMPLQELKEGESPRQWHLYDFYRKPGLRFKGDIDAIPTHRQMSWMNPDSYGYRTGTIEEYEQLTKLDKKPIETKTCCC